MSKETANNYVNLSYLTKNSGGSPLFIKELILTFLKNEANYINELQQIIENKDQEKFRFYCHKMRSNYATFGALQMVELIESIKDLDLENEPSEQIDALLKKANFLHQNIQSELLETSKKLTSD